MAVTLVVFIDDIDTLHKGLYQRYQHSRLYILCVFTEGQQSFFNMQYLYCNILVLGFSLIIVATCNSWFESKSFI